MCGIIGFVGDNTGFNRDLIKRLMLLLSLRGTHATGIAWWNSKKGLREVICPVPADLFWSESQIDYGSDTIRMVGHLRYSTSDLRWNQPMTNHERALVMNGVISQEPPAKWPLPENLNGVERAYRTGNDAEVALKYSESGNRAKMPGSWAICELLEDQLLAYRNNFRPLWIATGDNFIVVTSTADSLLRCDLKPKQLGVGSVFDLDQRKVVHAWPCCGYDLQGGLNSLFPNLQCSL